MEYVPNPSAMMDWSPCTIKRKKWLHLQSFLSYFVVVIKSDYHDPLKSYVQHWFHDCYILSTFSFLCKILTLKMIFNPLNVYHVSFSPLFSLFFLTQLLPCFCTTNLQFFRAIVLSIYFFDVQCSQTSS